MFSKEFLFLNKPLKKYKWIGGWEEFNSERVYLWRREGGKRIIVSVADVPRYMCIPKGDRNKTNLWEKWKKAGLYIRGVPRENYDYIYLNGISKKRLDDWFTELDNLGIKPLEGDVTRLSRLMIEMGLEVASPSDINGPRICYYDIETDDRNEKIEIGKDRILSVTIKDGHTEEDFFFCLETNDDTAEKKLLLEVVTKLCEYDVIVGYNNYKFDDLYLTSRCEYLGISLQKLRRLCFLDMYNLLERQHIFKAWGVASKKLDIIAKRILGYGKIEHNSKIFDLWENNRNLLKQYNLEDVKLVFDLEKRLRSVNLVLEVMSLSGTLYSFGFSTYRCIDNILLRYSQKNREKGIADFRYPTAFYRPEHKLRSGQNGANASTKRKTRAEILREEYDIDYEQVQGALVLDVVPGLYKNVTVADFVSLYPNVIRAFNIGLDTRTDKQENANETPNGISYRTDIRSNLAEVLDVLLQSRAEIRSKMKLMPEGDEKRTLDIRQIALKELANSCYGVHALWGGRYYAKEVAESITTSGRYFLNYAVDFYKNRGYRIVAGDTDSIFLELPIGVDSAAEIELYVNSLREHLKTRFRCFWPETLNLSLEKTAESLLIVAKKLYAMLIKGEKKSFVYKGLRVIKGNLSKWSSSVLTKLIEDILSKNYDYDYFVDFLLARKRDLETGNWDWRDLLISQGLGKALDEYSTELPHVVVARRLRANGVFVPEYSVINYIVTGKKDNKIQAVADVEVTDGVNVDVTYYWNNEIISGAVDYLSIIFPEIDWARYKYPNKHQLKVRISQNKNHIVLPEVYQMKLEVL